MKAFIDLYESILSEKIVHRDGKWIVTNKSGTKVLGSHSNKKDAVKQLQAIEISKHGG